MLHAVIQYAETVDMPNYSTVLLKRVSEVRILFGTPVESTVILTSCSAFSLFGKLRLLKAASLGRNDSRRDFDRSDSTYSWLIAPLQPSIVHIYV